MTQLIDPDDDDDQIVVQDLSADLSFLTPFGEECNDFGISPLASTSRITASGTQLTLISDNNTPATS